MSAQSRCVRIVFIVTLMPSLVATSWGHHATAAQYDTTKTVSFTGVVFKLDWSNPHVHAAMDVTEASGKYRWDVELASPGGVIVAGLSRDRLKPGTVLTVTGYPGKSDRLLCAVQVKTDDGAIATFTVGI